MNKTDSRELPHNSSCKKDREDYEHRSLQVKTTTIERTLYYPWRRYKDECKFLSEELDSSSNKAKASGRASQPWHGKNTTKGGTSVKFVLVYH